MLGKKLIAIMGMAGCLGLSSPGFAASGFPVMDKEAMVKAIQNCPGLNGKITPEQFMEAAKNCPGLNGQLPPGAANCPALSGGPIDPQAFAAAAAKCPALNGQLPPDASKCPALNGQLPAVPGKAIAGGPGKGPGDASKCPALAGKPGKPGKGDPMVARADAQMKKIVKALEQNKRSAEALIAAARAAGADPNAIADLEKMSATFRQVFMSTVSPQQIIESIFAAPKEDGGALIITGPDGSQWLVAPQPMPQVMPKQPKPEAAGPGIFVMPRSKPAQGSMMPPPPGQPGQPGMTPPPPPQPGMMPPPPPPGQPGMTPPPPPQPGGTPPPPQPGQPAAELIIMEQGQGLPLWPTKDHLGKDGILNYLQKRTEMQNN